MISSLEHLSTREEACTRTEERAALLLLQGRARGAVCDKEDAKEVMLLSCGWLRKVVKEALETAQRQTGLKLLRRKDAQTLIVQMPKSFYHDDRMLRQGCWPSRAESLYSASPADILLQG